MKRKKYCFISLAVMLLFAVVFFYLSETRNLDSVRRYLGGEELEFSLSSGFYQTGEEVRLKKAFAFPFYAEIRYTLDGSEPTADSKRYQQPILLTAAEKESVHTIRAAVFLRGERGEIYTGTYITGSQVASRYDLPVFSIVTDQEGLYGHEEGILVEGKLFEDYQKENPSVEESDFMTPANYNQTDWVRQVHVTVFEPDGTCVISQQAGLTVGGNASRQEAQKTLNLEADSIYDPQQPRFYYNFWEEEGAGGRAYSEPVSYNKIKLRNGGQDFLLTQLRNQISSDLAREAGLIDTAKVRPAVVYLNNEYYGVAFLQPGYSKSYIGAAYGLDKDFIDIRTGDENHYLEALGYPGGEIIDATDKEEQRRLEERIDMDNLLLYYAVQMIMGNNDFPHNNIKMWRYTGTEIEGNPYSDGRARFLVFDTDYIYGLRSEFSDVFDLLFYNEERTDDIWDFFYWLTREEKYRIKFVNILSDLKSGTFATSHVLETAYKRNREIARELLYTERQTKLPEVSEILDQREEAVNQLLYYIQ